MRFSDLHEMIPFARYGKAKSLTMTPYNGITLALPGRHAENTSPKGGDFVVMVDDEKLNWTKHQFTHSDIFRDIQKKYDHDAALTKALMENYFDCIHLDKHVVIWTTREGLPGLHPQTFLYSVQCLAVAEHRRYHQHEIKFGGRYLPFRASAGIAEGLWDASEAGEKTRKMGRPGVEWLEKESGIPTLTQKLMTP